jgi:polysaccharide export outer membrane protein
MILLASAVIAAQAPAPAAKPDAAAQKEIAKEAPTQDADRTSYKLGPTDQLNIEVTGEPDLSGKWVVDDTGSISYPYLNRVSVVGLTAAEVEDKLRNGLKAGYLRNPQVRVEIGQYKSQKVIVMGEVRTTGTLVLSGSNVSLLEALGMAGSVTANASNIVTVTRPKKGKEDGRTFTVDLRNLDQVGSLILQDGDVIKVPVAQRFYIDGMVRNPGSYVIEGKMTLEQAVVLAGGLNDRGSLRGAVAERTVKGRLEEVKLKPQDPVFADDYIKIKSRLF